MIAGLLAAAILLVSCQTTGTPAEVPEWARALDAVYPRDQYIAQIGYGESREAARVNAAAEISLYFSREMETTISSRESLREGGGLFSVSRSLDSATFIRSQTTFFALRYSELWRNQKDNQWETVAYIDRDEAWEIFESRLSQGAHRFQSLFDEAGNEGEAIRRLLLYRKAEAAAEAEDLQAKLFFAVTLDPQKAAAFNDVRFALESLPLMINDAKQGTAVFIDCPVDFNGEVAATLTRVLGAEGFIITGDRQGAGAVCLVKVEEGLDQGESITFYTPQAAVTINGTAGKALLSFAVRGPREGAKNPDLAKRRAYAALTKEITAYLPKGLEDL
jgi:hypothetical protein